MRNIITAMLILFITIFKILRWPGFQWHNVNTKFHEDIELEADLRYKTRRRRKRKVMRNIMTATLILLIIRIKIAGFPNIRWHNIYSRFHENWLISVCNINRWMWGQTHTTHQWVLKYKEHNLSGNIWHFWKCVHWMGKQLYWLKVFMIFFSPSNKILL